jgi:hypothetical protein
VPNICGVQQGQQWANVLPHFLQSNVELVQGQMMTDDDSSQTVDN